MIALADPTCALFTKVVAADFTICRLFSPSPTFGDGLQSKKERLYQVTDHSFIPFACLTHFSGSDERSG
ncbi:hypothetical protein XI00_19595 [Bradyrhizobium sp. CCBAU 21359]|nr:hypothetical protein [Bradyrhizobium sp. CCBAU 21359]